MSNADIMDATGVIKTSYLPLDIITLESNQVDGFPYNSGPVPVIPNAIYQVQLRMGGLTASTTSYFQLWVRDSTNTVDFPFSFQGIPSTDVVPEIIYTLLTGYINVGSQSAITIRAQPNTGTWTATSWDLQLVRVG